ncbi:MAG: transketolase [Gammaproteobacteria bacterium]|nr:transketolase [Gammaproteobacteria bacterium]
MVSHRQMANAIRALSMDAVQKANSGHPGAPMGMADIAEVLWTEYLKHNPANPEWVDRDRFVLSNGHGSMLMYSLLHLTGYPVPMSELENFRQIGSMTPGHPEYGDTPGVETTTGPLGQGFANAVGMAVAEKVLAGHFNVTTAGATHKIVDHRTWVFAGDGCFMEGISHEVASLAGTLGLGKLTCVYDDNGISIDGETKGWFTDDTPKRFEAYGWHVIRDVDGHDRDAVKAAIDAAIAETGKPTLICAKTTIGFGAPTKAGTAATHGAPLGEDEVKGARERLEWSHGPFEVPQEIYDAWDCRRKGAEAEGAWKQQFAAYAEEHPGLAKDFERRVAGDLPSDFAKVMDKLLAETNERGEKMASRKASGKVIEQVAGILPELIGGSADLSGSNNTLWPEARALSASEPDGNYLYYGVREFGMTAIGNGIALHGGLIPFVGTFLIFMEYARNAVRMSALMGIRNILVYTHDSIGQGEDGPTHQPVEQLANLRGTPNMAVWRPCDAVEAVVAWRAALERKDGPTALVFSRQDLPHQPRTKEQLDNVARGAYIIRQPDRDPDVIVIATGSEVDIAVQAHDALASEDIAVRVVSMPSVDRFEAQDEAYRESVLPSSQRKRLAVESAHPDYWRKIVGLDGAVVGMTTFGASGPGAEVMRHFGFTADNVVNAIKEMLQRP